MLAPTLYEMIDSGGLPLRFGTDGVRARVGTVLDEAAVRALGLVAATHLKSERVVVGRDTRESGPVLSRALAEGLVAGGVEAVSLGVVPTPAVAYTCCVEGVAGAIVTASHNPWHDNGIKFFSNGGRKLDDVAQNGLQLDWDARPRFDGVKEPVPWVDPEDLVAGGSSWADSLVASGVEDGEVERPLDGLSLIVDCANGALSLFAVGVLRRLGSEVEAINAAPNGRNINADCGSTHPMKLQAAVVAAGADAGLAFDGDGDRVVAVADDGTLLDGDDLMAVCAIDLHERGRLDGETIAVTVMSNLGLRRAMASHGIDVFETPVGDRHVLDALDAHGWVLGGEQSGHLVFRDLSTTGDGLLTGIRALLAAARSGRTLGGRVNDLIVRAPQVLQSVPVLTDGAIVVDRLATELAETSAQLGLAGRVLVRPSGTEPVVRVMVEAFDAAEAAAVADRLVEAVRRADVP